MSSDLIVMPVQMGIHSPSRTRYGGGNDNQVVALR